MITKKQIIKRLKTLIKNREYIFHCLPCVDNILKILIKGLIVSLIKEWRLGFHFNKGDNKGHNKDFYKGDNNGNEYFEGRVVFIKRIIKIIIKILIKKSQKLIKPIIKI